MSKCKEYLFNMPHNKEDTWKVEKGDVFVKSQFSHHSYSIVYNNVCIELYQSQIQWSELIFNAKYINSHT